MVTSKELRKFKHDHGDPLDTTPRFRCPRCQEFYYTGAMAGRHGISCPYRDEKFIKDMLEMEKKGFAL